MNTSSNTRAITLCALLLAGCGTTPVQPEATPAAEPAPSPAPEAKPDNETTFGGIGVMLVKSAGGAEVTEALFDGPAQRAGLQAGDVITAIEGTPIAALPLSEISTRLRGAAGSKVALTISRSGQTTPLELSITREIVDPRSSQKPAAVAARVKALVERTRRNLVFLEGGSFVMGDWGTEVELMLPYDMDGDSKPMHKVTLDSFSMQAYRVTYEEFDTFTDAAGEERINMDSYGIKFRGPRKAASPNWYGAKAYCEWLGKVTDLPFDLPTEAQWEYAARARGQRLLYATDNGQIDRGRNYPPKWEWGTPEPDAPNVGTYPPNPAGLYGMSESAAGVGEGFEWTDDWYEKDYYKHSPENNPRGPESGAEKVVRGNHGSPAEAAAMVFMRYKLKPRRTRMQFGKPGEVLDTPIEGFSSLPSNAFRCAVDSPKPVK